MNICHHNDMIVRPPCKVATGTNFNVFGMAQPGIEPTIVVAI